VGAGRDRVGRADVDRGVQGADVVGVRACVPVAQNHGSSPRLAGIAWAPTSSNATGAETKSLGLSRPESVSCIGWSPDFVDGMLSQFTYYALCRY
jgi:hypothetical protein